MTLEVSAVVADELASWWRVFNGRTDNVDPRELLARACGDLFTVYEIDKGAHPDVSGIVRQDIVDGLFNMAASCAIDPNETQDIFAANFKHHAKVNGDGRTYATPAIKILSNAEFLADFVPPDYLVDGMLQRRFIYALTGQTGHAKTAVALLLARLVACADKNALLGTHRCEKGRVVYFVGENPDDVRMRLIGANAIREDDWRLDNIWFVPGRFDIPGMMQTLETDFRTRGECSLIIVDTSAAYFLGNEELSNTQMGAHARMLRQLTGLPGGPCVLVLCHPIKHTTEPEQLLPRGGGAYLAEVDGNLTLWRTGDELVELSHNKMRGPGFQPLAFRLDPIKNSVFDKKGRPLTTVQAVAITSKEQEQRENSAQGDEDSVLAAMLASPDDSLAGWATKCNWFLDTGEAYKSKVVRVMVRLEKSRPVMVRKQRNKYVLTDEGKVIARQAALKTLRTTDDKNQTRMDGI